MNSDLNHLMRPRPRVVDTGNGLVPFMGETYLGWNGGMLDRR